MKVKMKELNKKTISTLIISILMLSMAVGVIPVSAAVTLSLVPSLGPVGTEVVVTVTGVTIGGLVKVYWDSVKLWDGKAGLLAEDYAVNATATIDIVIPEAVAGGHYVITKDVESGQSSSATFTVDPEIVLDPTAGIAGDTITVTGTV